jgi:hypothetical protein
MASPFELKNMDTDIKYKSVYLKIGIPMLCGRHYFKI